MKQATQTIIALVLTSFAFPALAQEEGGPTAAQMKDTFSSAPYSPYAGTNIPTRVFWGDTHVHTSYSFDAGAFGARRNLLGVRLVPIAEVNLGVLNGS